MSDAKTDTTTDDPVVGHKTMRDGTHIPLHRSEADTIMACIERSKAERVALMPDERSAIHAMFYAYIRLKELGWDDAVYCPKDGSSFNVIEPGSTGIHPCHYEGEWPNGTWWIEEDDGDSSSSRPVLFKRRPADQAIYDAKMEAARARYRAEMEAESNAE